MEDITAFIGFLLLTGSLFFLAKFVLEQDEFRYIRNMSPFFTVVAALLFWGAGRLDPSLSAVNKFFVSGCLTLALALAAQAFQRKKRRPLVALVLALIAAALAVPLILLVLWLLFAWFPSTFFTPPPTLDRYESRLINPRHSLSLTPKTGSAGDGVCLVVSVQRGLPLPAAKPRHIGPGLSPCNFFACPAAHPPAEKAQAWACPRQHPALNLRA